jgi:hypothetical protein
MNDYMSVGGDEDENEDAEPVEEDGDGVGQE